MDNGKKVAVTATRGQVIAVGLVVVLMVGAFLIGRATAPTTASLASQAAPSPTSAPTSASPAPSAATPTSTTAANRAILPPATTPPVVDECSQQLNYGADGSYGPLSCANGTQVNVLAWAAAAKSNSLVLSLGPNASPNQVEKAACADIKGQTVPIETGIYQLAALYYGWNFGYDPTQVLIDGNC